MSQQIARDVNASAVRAMAAGDFAAARQILEQATRAMPGGFMLWLNLAACCRALGDIGSAMAAVDSALRLQPRAFAALLMKASLIERNGKRRQAAKLYGVAAKLAPPDGQLDSSTLRALQHARYIHGEYQRELADFVDSRAQVFYQRGSSAVAVRLRSFAELSSGRRRNFRQEPSEFFYPGMPEIEFYDRESFGWLPEFEQAADTIRGELLEILKQNFQDFSPYVVYSDNVPLDQWAELNHSDRWSALHLYHYGERVERYCQRCPQTMAALAPLPQPWTTGRSPTAMFSALKPGTRIPPHTGVTNTRLVVHLPLIVPPDCGFRVGNQTRQWREGHAWVFDDTIEHEAWNLGSLPRVILICDIWHPQLDTVERELISEVMQAMDEFNGEQSSAAI
jgi:aspartate beta-hydroxylase